MSRILPKGMRRNRRWRIGVPYELMADLPRDLRYRPDPRGNLVAPASARRDAIGILDLGFARRAHADRLCSGCGKQFDALELKVFLKASSDLEEIQIGDYVHHAEPPLHMACAGYAVRACPHMREEQWNAVIVTDYSSGWCDDDRRFEFSPTMEGAEIVSYEDFLVRTHPRL